MSTPVTEIWYFTIETIAISAIVGGPVSTAGGHQLDLSLSLVDAGDIEVLIDGIPCYGGQGYGYLPQTDGLTVKVYTPPIATVGAKEIVVTQGALASDPFPLTVLERPWFGKQFGLRASFPSWAGIGRRRLGEEF